MPAECCEAHELSSYARRLVPNGTQEARESCWIGVRGVVETPRLKAMSSGASAEGYAPGERSKAVQSHQPPQDATAAEWQRPATWPAWKEAPTPSNDAPHVVLSTKFEEPWYTVSRGLKEILQERGCTVYNPNTDNKEPRLNLLRYKSVINVDYTTQRIATKVKEP